MAHRAWTRGCPVPIAKPVRGLAFLALIVLVYMLHRAFHCSDNCSTRRHGAPAARNIIRQQFREPLPMVLASPLTPPATPASAVFGGFYQVDDEQRFIHSAFLDQRFKSAYIRIFGMQSQSVTSDLNCRFYSEGTKIDLPSEKIFPIYESWPSPKLQYHAYYYGCAVPDVFDFRRNVTFAVFAPGRDSETIMPLNHLVRAMPMEPKGELAVCVKAIWGNVNATRLVEWLEFNRHLGVEKFVFYDITTTGAAVRVLLYYKSLGLVDVVPFAFTLNMATLMKDDPMRPHLSNDDLLLEQTFIVSMNDCFYRYKELYRHLVVIDLDEVIVPTSGDESLVTLVARAEQQYPGTSAFLFPTAWHFEQFGPTESVGVPSYLHMQRYLKRTPIMQSQPKAIINTEGAVSINWHGVITMPTGHGFLGNKYLPWQHFGYVHHYRNKCKSDATKCMVMLQMVELDEIVPKYLNVLQPRIEEVIQHLSLRWQ